MKNKPQFSKVMVVITTIIFIATLIGSFGFMIYVTLCTDGEIVDYVVATTSLTVVAGLYGMVLKGYLSKSALENTSQIRKSVYQEVMKTRIEFIREVLELRKEYDVDQDVIDEIESEGPFEELSDAVIGQTTNKLDAVDSENEQEPEIPSL